MKTPYLELALGRIVPTREGGNQERGTAIRLASDLIYTAARNFYDTAVVITEEPSFADALEQVKLLGRHVEVALFPDVQPRALTAAADLVLPLKEILDRYSHRIFPDDLGNRIVVPELVSLKKRAV
jgi:hypothetical protein